MINIKNKLLYKLTISIIKNFIIDIRKKKNINYIKSINKKYLENIKIYFFFIKKIKCINKKKKINLLVENIKKIFKNIFIKNRNNIIYSIKKKNKHINIKSPSIKNILGNFHPISLIIEEIKCFFLINGYKLFNTNEIENYKYNFNFLNINNEHISRNNNDTYWINHKYLLKTHNTSSQVRYLHNFNNMNIPIKIFSYGKVHRNDNIDNNHLPMFYQLDVFNIDNSNNINILSMIKIIYKFLYYILNDKIKINIRNSFFPFTEPSIEIDILFNNKWIEILGAGLIHRNIIKNTNLDHNKISGFAFGLGIERLLMIKFNIKDIRHIYYNDIRFIKNINKKF